MRKFLAYFHISFIDTFTYRGDILLYLLSGIVTPLVLLAVWLSIQSSGGSLPLALPQMIQYYLWVMVLGILTGAWASFFITRDIRHGQISSFLIKPAPFVFYQLSNNLAEKIIKSILLVPIFLLVWWLFNLPIPELSLLQWMAFFISVILSFFMRFYVDLGIGLTTFWLEDTFALNEGTDFLVMLFSGRLMPIVVFPPFVQSILFFTPFRYMFSFPIEIVINQISSQQIFQGLIIQSLWVLSAIYLQRYLWAKGLVHYSASGA